MGVFCSGEEDGGRYLSRNGFRWRRTRGILYSSSRISDTLPFSPCLVPLEYVAPFVLSLHFLYFNHFSLLSAATEESISRFQSILSSYESREVLRE